MSYRSERKLGRQGFDGKYRRSFHASASSMDLTAFDSGFQDGKNVFSPSSWEQIHNIRQHGTTVIFHSDCLQQGNHLQRSNSQDCVPIEEAVNNGLDHISNNFDLQNSENQSPNNSSQCSETQDHQQQSVPYPPPSHERVSFEVQNSPSDSRQNSLRTKGMSSKSKNSDVILNCETSDSHCSLSLNNGSLTDGNLINTDIDTNVDLNQNSVKNNKSERVNSKTLNGTDINNRINSATQTTDTPRLHRKYCKTKAELECEQLSLDFVHSYGDVTLKNLLIPAPNHKTMTDYIEGLLNVELDKNGLQAHNAFLSKNQNGQREEKRPNGNEKIIEGKVMNDCSEVNDNQNVNNDLELKKKKEELIFSIGKKVESLKEEQKNIRAEMIQNELLGKEIANQLQTVAKPSEIEKYLLHVEEMEKIVNLLLSLSGRLARSENILKNMQESNSEEKKLLEAKRDKLKEQHEDACRLKESIDRRSNQVSTFLHKYLSDNEYADYDRFIKMKTKLIVDIREIDEKINLGEEQLAALSVVAHLWKSANS
ncbi:protein Shroom3 [Trichonephila inaurata madagascariensis]|uniref:Protein Shroom3 n=1 Tax=Trichonephila inaurata madagascariensis TaxID=2747483 RepID=A0A8X6XR91_9ARAC|nr:protein Shroom3 [Trichonephila inaurata madagascariensis]